MLRSYFRKTTLKNLQSNPSYSKENNFCRNARKHTRAHAPAHARTQKRTHTDTRVRANAHPHAVRRNEYARVRTPSERGENTGNHTSAHVQALARRWTRACTNTLIRTHIHTPTRTLTRRWALGIASTERANGCAVISTCGRTLLASILRVNFNYCTYVLSSSLLCGIDGRSVPETIIKTHESRQKLRFNFVRVDLKKRWLGADYQQRYIDTCEHACAF